MSNLFVDMHQRHINRASRRSSNQNFTAAAIFEDDEECKPQLFNGTAKEAQETADNTDKAEALENEDYDPLANILSLKLKKPKNWRWELTTSRSCTNIALPRILLYDHNGELLMDANSQTEETYKQEQQPARMTRPRKRTSRAVTSSLAQSIRAALDRELNGLQIQEATPTPTNTLTPEHSTQSTRRPSPASNSASNSNCIDFYTNDLPDYHQQLERRSSSLKSVRFQVDDTTSKDECNSFHVVDLPTPPSTISTTATTTPTTNTTSSSSGPREKRRYRRSHSSGRSIRSGGSGQSINNNNSNHINSNTPTSTSESILERFSFSKGRYSSPEEYADEMAIQHAPRYFLRTSKAGTLVVQHESFSRYRRRRRPKHSSSENLNNALTAHSRSSSGLLKVADATAQLQVPSGSDDETVRSTNSSRKKLLPIRRYRSDGNILLADQQDANQFLSTSEEEERARVQENQQQQQWSDQQRQLTNGGCAGQQRKYSNLRRQSKKDLSPEHRVRPALEFPAAR